jgi:hypothetical protein
MRKLVLVMLLAAGTAHADVGIGGFFGDPSGLDLKFGMAPRSGLDVLLGWYDFRGLGNGGYAHVTYLVTPIVGHGESVIVPLRVGIGGAVFGDNGDNIDFGVRFPLEVGLRFRSAPLEIYGEVAALFAFVHPRYELFNVQGGVGLRFYF